jgi:hypothetical protein
MNKKNFKAVLDKIQADPSCWNQSSWHCGTSHCFAGHAQILAGKEADDTYVRQHARIFLELNIRQANFIFDSKRTIEDFKEFLNTEGYDADGFDGGGWDRQGYNRAGFHIEGYDRDHLDRNLKPRPEF